MNLRWRRTLVRLGDIMDYESIIIATDSEGGA